MKNTTIKKKVLKKQIKEESQEKQLPSNRSELLIKYMNAELINAKQLKDPTKFNLFMRRIKQRFLKNTKKKKVTIINIELQNGNYDTFYIKYEYDSFVYNNGRYLFDNDSKYFHEGFRCWCYDYREGFPLPIKRQHFPINDVRKAFEDNTDIDYEYSLNAKNLQQFQISKVIESVLSGHALGEQFKRVVIMVIIALIISTINMFIGFQLYSMIKHLGGA